MYCLPNYRIMTIYILSISHCKSSLKSPSPPHPRPSQWKSFVLLVETCNRKKSIEAEKRYCYYLAILHFFFYISRVQYYIQTMWIFTSCYILLNKKCSIHKGIKLHAISKWEDKKLAYCFLARSGRSTLPPGTGYLFRTMISIILLVCWGAWPHTLFFFLVLELVFR